MPYIVRNNRFEIVALLKEPALGSDEFLPSDNPEIRQFLGTQSEENARSALSHSDRELARVTEDLIQLLIQKNLILFTELPEAVQQKLLTREKLRASISAHSTVNFMDDDGLI